MHRPAGDQPAHDATHTGLTVRERAAQPSGKSAWTSPAVWWTLRAGAFLCFVGHGAFGIATKEGWVRYFSVVGIGRETAFQLMPIVGTSDVLLGVLVLVRPRAALLLFMSVWAVWTASLRPLTGEPVWEMLERAGNYGVPFALLMMCEWSRVRRSWFAPMAMTPLSSLTRDRLRPVLVATVALLLIGHGALAMEHKPELVSHLGLLRLPVSSASLLPVFGLAEIGFAAWVLWRPSAGLCLFLFGWKLVTELLFLADGAPAWDVVERGGSYAAPLALALLLRVALPHRAA